MANAFSVPRPQLRVWVTFYNYYFVAEPNKNIKNGTNIKAFYSIAKLRRSEAVNCRFTCRAKLHGKNCRLGSEITACF